MGYNIFNDCLLKGGILKLDYSLTSVEDRKKVVQSIIDLGEHLSQEQLNYMTDYLLFTADGRRTVSEKREQYPIVTKNRDVTVRKRQTSLEDTISRLQNGEDGLYAMIINDKDAIMDVREPITEEDMESIPGLKEKKKVIESLKRQLDEATGKRKYSLKRQIISTYQELYTLKASFSSRTPKAKMNAQVRSMAHMEIPESIRLSEDGRVVSDGFISLIKQDHVAFLLKYYQLLKQESWEDVNSDMRWLLIDLEDTVVRALLPQDEILYDLLVWEIDGHTGAEIAEMMADKYNIFHSEQYFSTLWCKKIPKMVAEQAQKDWLIWHYTHEAPEDAKWKLCRTCGKVKPANALFFHKNTSKDGFYSKCRDCRSKKGGGVDDG